MGRAARAALSHCPPPPRPRPLLLHCPSAFRATQLRGLAVLAGLAVVLCNYLVTLAVRALTVGERWHTHTSSERNTSLKLSVAYLLNAFVVPLLAAYLSGNTHSWYSRGGLMESAFFLQAANAILPPLATLLGPRDLLRSQVAARWARTQPMMNRLLAPPEFPLAEQYASGEARRAIACVVLGGGGGRPITRAILAPRHARHTPRPRRHPPPPQPSPRSASRCGGCRCFRSAPCWRHWALRSPTSLTGCTRCAAPRARPTCAARPRAAARARCFACCPSCSCCSCDSCSSR